jgi:hypothetical protein
LNRILPAEIKRKTQNLNTTLSSQKILRKSFMEIETTINLDEGKEVWLNVKVKFYDDGVGNYEFFGGKGYDKKLGFDIVSVSHDEELTDEERKEVEEYLESNEFQEKIGLLIES